MRLQAFLADARRRVRQGRYDIMGDPLAPHGDFVAGCRDGIIAELKPRSPSEGPLPAGIDDAIQAYREADAVSVLTDGDHFDGSPDLLRRAHAAGRPTMMKDFIVDDAQITCAAHHGASAVLLIERCLQPARREALVSAAHDHGLQVLLEVHGSDWQTAQSSEADLIGVNARDLDTLEVDTAGAWKLMDDIAGERSVAALSGVLGRQDRVQAMSHGAHAVLVGTMLMRCPAPHLAIQALRRPIVKVCGLTRVDDVHAASGADMAGFVLAKSPRRAALDLLPELVAAAREIKAEPVAVYRHGEPDPARALGMRFVQCAGHDGLADRAWLATVPPGSQPPEAPGVLVDTPSSQGGGSGVAHDWTITASTVEAARGRLSLVAGGLAADNVADALLQSGAWGADASSRLEAEPGRKDHDAVQAFISAAKSAMPKPQ